MVGCCHGVVVAVLCCFVLFCLSSTFICAISCLYASASWLLSCYSVAVCDDKFFVCCGVVCAHFVVQSHASRLHSFVRFPVVREYE